MSLDGLSHALGRASYFPETPEQFAALHAAKSANSANPSERQAHRPANSPANSLRSLSENPEWDVIAAPPKATPEMFYGVLGQLARQAASGTEVSPVAAMAAAMSWLSACVGRNTCITVGDEWHHLRLFTLHVGRSSRGGKGMALGLLKRINQHIERTNPGVSPQMHTGGLSSREGLAFLIHDGYREGKTEVPAIDDKRLFIVETEFANVLGQGRREGNTLSSALRDAWDGTCIKPATKSSRIWASRPHVALHGCITPGELRARIAANDLTNGFANRHLIFWAERSGQIPFPNRASDDVVRQYAQSFTEIIEEGLAGYPTKDEPRRLRLDRGAEDSFRELYAKYTAPGSTGDAIASLLVRRPPMLLRIAGLFAVTDRKTDISRQHVAAAAAWMDYYAQSVALVFAPTVDGEGEIQRSEKAEDLLKWLASRDWQSRTSISRECFKGHMSKEQINAVIEGLVLEQRLERREMEGDSPTKRTEYRVCPPEKQEFAESSHQSSRAQVSDMQKSSQNSQSSHVATENGAFEGEL